MFYNVLDKPRLDLLPLLAGYRERFYLAGGTALALQIGHRLSFDFDFFSEREFDPGGLLAELERDFKPRRVTAVQHEKNTLTVIVGDDIKLSFFYYPYRLVQPVIDEAALRLAAPADIGCMKLSAIVSRAVNKDYVDLYYILRDIPLPKLLELAGKKLPSLDRNLILKSLVYFQDVLVERLVFLPGKEVSMDTIREFLVAEVKKASPVG